MGRLTEAVFATDKPGNKHQYSYIRAIGKKRPGVAIAKDYPVKLKTARQIENYVNRVEQLCLVYHSDGKLLFEGVQIIRQLQEDNANLVQAMVLSAGEQPL